MDDVACAKTDKNGNALAAIDVEKGAQYFVIVGRRSGSPPGDFSLEALAAQSAERSPGEHLSAAGARSTVNGLTDVNDIWWRHSHRARRTASPSASRGCAELLIMEPQAPRMSGSGISTAAGTPPSLQAPTAAAATRSR